MTPAGSRHLDVAASQATTPTPANGESRDPQWTPGDTGESAEGSGPGAFFRALRRRWKLALVVALLAVGLTAPAVWQLAPVRHTVRSLVRIHTIQPVIMATPNSQANFLNYQRSQLVLLKSRPVLEATLRRPEVAALPAVQASENAAEWLEKAVKADFTLAPEVMQIFMTGSDPAVLAILVDAVRDSYINEIVDKERNEDKARMQRLKQAFGDYEVKLQAKRKEMRDLARAAGSNDTQALVQKHQATLERLALSQKELTELQTEMRRTRLEAAGQQARDDVLEKQPVGLAAVEEILAKDPVIAYCLKKVAEAEEAAEQVKLFSQRPDSAMQNHLAMRDAAMSALQSREAKLRPEIEKQLRLKTQTESRANLAQAKARLETLKELEQQVQEQIKSITKVSAVINKDTIDFDAIKEEIIQLEDMAKKVNAQAETLKVELDAPLRVTVLEQAIISSPDGRNRMLLTGGVGLLALFCSVTAVGFLELRSRRIASADEVQQ